MISTTMKRSTFPIPKLVIMVLLLLSVASIERCEGFTSTKRTAPSSPTSWRGVVTAATTGSQRCNPSQSALNVVDPSVEAESLTVLAHLALDFSGLMSPSRSLLRLFAVLGRVFAMSADYLYDHNIYTEELFIQMFLISVALKELFFDGNATTTSSTNSSPRTSNQTK
jgi:hypothetical protein